MSIFIFLTRSDTSNGKVLRSVGSKGTPKLCFEFSRPAFPFPFRAVSMLRMCAIEESGIFLTNRRVPDGRNVSASPHSLMKYLQTFLPSRYCQRVLSHSSFHWRCFEFDVHQGQAFRNNETGEIENSWFRQDSDERRQRVFLVPNCPMLVHHFLKESRDEVLREVFSGISSKYGRCHRKGHLANRNSDCICPAVSWHRSDPAQTCRRQYLLG
jgi:hypothetical protein